MEKALGSGEASPFWYIIPFRSSGYFGPGNPAIVCSLSEDLLNEWRSFLSLVHSISLGL